MLLNGCVLRPTGEVLAYGIVRSFLGDSVELQFWAKAFHADKGRWPKDYTELRGFVARESNGSLPVRQYEKVNFTLLPGDKLHVRSISNAHIVSEYVLSMEPHKG